MPLEKKTTTTYFGSGPTKGKFGEVMKIISILNNKGGGGKTTLGACSAQALALIGFRVLAIDNDNQQNLSMMLGVDESRPNILDVYRSDIGTGAKQLLNSIRKTEISNLSVLPGSKHLRNGDVKDTYLLKKCIKYCMLNRFYDYVLIDNKPGLDLLQESALHASDEIFVPTELSTFALHGISELQKTLLEKFPNDGLISKIIPNFYRNTKQQNAHLLSLKTLFPQRVTSTNIPHDKVFDTLVREKKILFLHRLLSRGAAHYVKLIHELFALDEETLWKTVVRRRRERRSQEARDRFYKQLEINKAAILHPDI